MIDAVDSAGGLTETSVNVIDFYPDIEQVERRQNDIPKSCAGISRAEADPTYQLTVSMSNGLQRLVG